MRRWIAAGALVVLLGLALTFRTARPTFAGNEPRALAAIPSPISDPHLASTPSPNQPAVLVNVRPDGSGRLLVAMAAPSAIQRVTWPPVPNVAVETREGAPIVGGSLMPMSGRPTAVLYIRRLSGTSATLPLTITGAFGEWRTFVGGGPDAW